MRNVTRLVALGTMLFMAACQKKQPEQEQNIIVDSGNVPANADIEALPPDESSGTSTEELANGADSPDDDTDTNNSY